MTCGLLIIRTSGIRLRLRLEIPSTLPLQVEGPKLSYFKARKPWNNERRYHATLQMPKKLQEKSVGSLIAIGDRTLQNTSHKPFCP